jgi:hypothetical protein
MAPPIATLPVSAKPTLNATKKCTTAKLNVLVIALDP